MVFICLASTQMNTLSFVYNNEIFSNEDDAHTSIDASIFTGSGLNVS